MRILVPAAELFPLAKVGGLADMVAGLSLALQRMGLEIRLALPAYPALKEGCTAEEEVLTFPDVLGCGPAHISLGKTASGIPIYLVEHPFFERPGGPYDDWGDSHQKFGLFSWAVAQLALRGDPQGWKPQIVHAHDWQAGLIPVYLSYGEADRPRSVFTIHNIAYQGVFGADFLDSLWLRPESFHAQGVELHGQINFLKSGIQYSDKITTVSPTHAKEVQDPMGGRGLHTLLQQRAYDLLGILNGVDYEVWDPAHDPYLEHHYDSGRLETKHVCKSSLQTEVGLEVAPHKPLFVVISRLVEPKGLDMLLQNIEHLLSFDAQLLVLGSGDRVLEEGFRQAQEHHPGRIVARIAFDEGLAHRMLAGGDVILVPSRMEPCGLTQLYGLRYGTLPLVRRTGGLADSVVDLNEITLINGTATGFVFREPSSWVLGETIGRACHLYANHPDMWKKIQLRGMAQNFGWEASAHRYQQLYSWLLT